MRRRRVILGILLAALLVFFGLSVYIAYTLFTTSMGKPLSLITASATPADSKAVEKEPEVKAAAQPTATSKPLPTATSEPEGVCPAKGTTMMLFVGADFSLGVPPLGADAVRLVKLDFDTPGITVVAFPRDLMVDTVALKDPAHMNTPLGLSYYYMKQATVGTADEKILAGTNLIAQVLYDNFGAEAENYLTLQLDSVGAMIDEIGGVEITVPETVTTEHDVTFEAGPQNLNGRLSAEYVRFFFPGGEEARLKRQDAFVKALQKKVIQAGTITHLPELIRQFNQAIVTDLSPEMLVDYACLANAVPGEEIEFYEISGQLISIDANGQMIPDAERVQDFLEEVFGP